MHVGFHEVSQGSSQALDLYMVRTSKHMLRITVMNDRSLGYFR